MLRILTVSVHKSPNISAEKKSWKWQLEYGHSSTSQLWILILASTGRVQVTKCHENSGGYACVNCIL